MEQSETKSRLPYIIFPHKLYDKSLCYRNFPIDFVPLRNDWALANKRSYVISFRETMM